jgi:hypothetical protein
LPPPASARATTGATSSKPPHKIPSHAFRIMRLSPLDQGHKLRSCLKIQSVLKFSRLQIFWQGLLK